MSKKKGSLPKNVAEQFEVCHKRLDKYDEVADGLLNSQQYLIVDTGKSMRKCNNS